jgi:hypothetical protein
MSKGITLQNYIATRGVNQVATLCRVTPQTVYNWVNMGTCPDPFMCKLMIDDSMGMLSFNAILEPYVHFNYEVIAKHKLTDFKVKG